MKPSVAGGGQVTPPRPIGNQLPNGPHTSMANSPRNVEDASRMGASAFPKVSNPFAVQTKFQNQGSLVNNSSNEAQQQQQQQPLPQQPQQQQQLQQPPQQQQHSQQNFPHNNFGDMNNYNNRGSYNNYIDPRQQQQQ